DRMIVAGIRSIRIAEFSWNLVEPQEDVFDFGFFDRFLGLCADKGMKVIFGTPTATPLAWLTDRYPEVLNASRDGVLYRHGGRRHYNYNSRIYRRFAARVVEQEAKHYAAHPAIVGWQIDNELNCEVNEFYSEADSEAFRVFLKNKYGTLDELNRAWGTRFWNQTYTEWEQIYVMRPLLGDGNNPHQHLDYLRFISESTVSFCRMQADIIRRYKKPGDFIMTNGIFGNVDNHRMARECLDVYTYDSYPNFAFGLGENPKEPGAMNDRKWTRNLIEVRSVCPHFGIMEQQSGAHGWTTRMEAPAPRPGQVTLWAMQSVAQGADFVSFFRWRTACFGTEMYWHGILDYDSRDNRKLHEVKDFHQKLMSIGEVCGAQNVAAFALINDYDNLWDQTVDAWHRRVARPSEKEIFAASELMHTPYDVVFMPEDSALAATRSDAPDEVKCRRQAYEETLDSLRRYPVAIYPHPVIMSEERAQILKEYVEEGGILVTGCRSGYKDMDGHCVMMPQPGLLAELTGTDVAEFTFESPAEESVRAVIEDCAWDEKFSGCAGEDLNQGKCSIRMPVFCDVLHINGENVKVLARYENSYFAGEPAVTEHAYGKGKVIHFGSTFTRESSGWLFNYLGIAEPFADLIDAPAEAEVVLRRKDGKEYLFVLNFQAYEISYTLHKEAVLMYTGEHLTGRQTLGAYGTAVFVM
ncbi:MAG: beta-galactosidase, partial [Clostridiales bacterium]|nr:beta-galactosidase [Clostridiales bacterium]